MEAPLLQTAAVLALRVGVAILIMVIGRYLAGRLRSFTRELLARPQVDQALSASVEGILVRVVYYGTLAIALIIALAVLGVPAAAIVSVTSALLVVLAIALRESLANFAATVIFMIYQPFRIGEEIETMGRRGIVREIQLFNTVIMQTDRSLATLPNAEIQADGIINYTRLGINRINMPFTLKYEADIDRAREIIMDLMTNDPRVLKEPPPAVVALNMGEDGMELQARPFVRYADYDPVQFSFNQAIVERLVAAGIAFAVPQRDVTVTTTPTPADEPEPDSQDPD